MICQLRAKSGTGYNTAIHGIFRLMFPFVEVIAYEPVNESDVKIRGKSSVRRGLLLPRRKTRR